MASHHSWRGRPPGRGAGVPGGRPSQGDSRGAAGLPNALYSACQKRLKGEDVLFVREARVLAQDGPSWSLYCVAAGHGGAAAANYVRRHLWKTLGPLLPAARLPDGDGQDFEDFAGRCRVALVKAFMKVGEQFRTDAPADSSGAAVTAGLLCGRLLTVANVGDADAVLDTGSDTWQATVNHSLETNDAEQERLADAGAFVGPRPPSAARRATPEERGGEPARCWPGGVTVSRSVGDNQANEHILACPQVCQVTLPSSGARLLMGSRSLWDSMHWENAAQVIRRTPIHDAASTLIDLATLKHKRNIMQETSVLVVEMWPPGNSTQAQSPWRGLLRGRAGNRCAACKCRVCRCGCQVGGGQCWEEKESVDVRIVAEVDGWDIIRSILEAVHADSCSSMLMRQGPPVEQVQPQQNRRRAAGYSYPKRGATHLLSRVLEALFHAVQGAQKPLGAAAEAHSDGLD